MTAFEKEKESRSNERIDIGYSHRDKPRKLGTFVLRFQTFMPRKKILLTYYKIKLSNVSNNLLIVQKEFKIIL